MTREERDMLVPSLAVVFIDNSKSGQKCQSVPISLRTFVGKNESTDSNAVILSRSFSIPVVIYEGWHTRFLLTPACNVLTQFFFHACSCTYQLGPSRSVIDRSPFEEIPV